MRDVMKLIDEARSGRNMISWVTGVLAMVCYLGIRRFSDVNRVRVGEVSFREDGAVEVFMARRKTDMKNSVTQVLRDYIRVLGLKTEDFLFPRVSGSRVKDKHRCVAYAMAYRWLEMAKIKLDLEDGTASGLGQPTEDQSSVLAEGSLRKPVSGGQKQLICKSVGERGLGN